MSKEHKEGNKVNSPIIEFCGTPFPARDKFLVGNAIEDMVSERIGKKIKGKTGIMSYSWISAPKKSSRTEYFNNLHRVENLVVGLHQDSVTLIQDGVFSAMVTTDMARKAHLISQSESDNLTRGLLPYLKMQDFIVLTLVRPRAALSRSLYPPEHESYHNIMRAKYIFYSVYNESANQILKRHKADLPKIEVIQPRDDNFLKEEIFLKNANATFEFLSLPSTAEWSKQIEEGKVVLNLRFGRLSGRTMAGLTEDQIRSSLQEWDWSQRPEKKATAFKVHKEIIEVLENEMQLGTKS